MKPIFCFFAITLLSQTVLGQTNKEEAQTLVNASAQSWLKLRMPGFVLHQDTLAFTDSSESAVVVFDIQKDTDYFVGVVLSGEPNVTLQADDGGVGAEIYAAGIKDASGNTIAESGLKISESTTVNLNVITIGAGIGMPCRYLVLKKK